MPAAASPHSADHRLAEQIDKAQGGQVRLVAAGDVAECLSAIHAAGETIVDDTRVLVREWDSVPSHFELLDDVLDSLARLALAIWPAWYCESSKGQPESPSLVGPALLQRATTLGVRRQVDVNWLRRAIDLALKEQLPRQRDAPSSVEAEQLSLLFARRKCVIILAAVDSKQTPDGLFCLMRVAQWLAKETGAALFVVVSHTLAGEPELEAISYGSIRFEIPRVDEGTTRQGSQTAGTTESEKSTVETKSPAKEKEWLATPLIGKPHPNSKGEQLLWREIQACPDLQELFGANQPVTTTQPTNYLVDLLWPSGKLIVEVDGFYWHNSRDAFSRDRQRDYELVLSGYLVLRLPHDEVVADVDGAVKKIRELVAFRHANNERQLRSVE